MHLHQEAGLPFCRTSVVDEFSFRERGFCHGFLHEFSPWISKGPSVPSNEGQKIHREIHSKIHDKIPAKFTHVVKNGFAKSTLQDKVPDQETLLLTYL